MDAALYLGARVKRFARSEESGYAIDPVEVRRALTRETRLIVITNLHNPSSRAHTGSGAAGSGRSGAQRGRGCWWTKSTLDAVYENTPRTAFHLGPEFVVTSSLTKVYGVGGLRCGWVLAEPELAWKMRRLNDVFGATPVHPGEILSVTAFAHLQLLRERARRGGRRTARRWPRFSRGRMEYAHRRPGGGRRAFCGSGGETRTSF